MKAGILYPRSKVHQNMMPDFIDGLKICLKHKGLHDEIELLAESVGFGGNEKEVYEKAEKLLLLDEADLLIAYIDLRVLPVLEPLIHSTGKLLIVVNPGANYPENWVPQPTIVHLTLQQAFSCWRSGQQAGNVPAVVATSFYDCGYMHTAAITKGLINKGGTVSFNYINKDKYDASFEIGPLATFLSTETVTNMVCVLDSLPASLFYERLQQLEGADRFHLFVSPMMLEQQATGEMPSSRSFLIEGFTSYDPSSKLEKNIAFKNIFEQEKKNPSLFALQGWEAAIVLEHIYKAAIQPGDGVAAIEILGTTKIDSPRGELKFDPDTHYFLGPAYHCRVEKNTNEITATAVVDMEEEWKKFIANPVEGITSGWTNTYLCY